MSTVAEPTKLRSSKNLKNIPLDLIMESNVAMRGAETKNKDWPYFVDTIKKDGVLNPILVRELRDPENDRVIYGIVDGRQRYEASKLAGHPDIPAHIRQMNEGEVMEAQIIANVAKIETKHAQYAKQLMSIFQQNPLMTMSDMSHRLSRPPDWIRRRLAILNLPEHVQKMIDDGDIKLAQAVALVELNKLVPDEVGNFLDRAQTAQRSEFTAQVNERVKQIREMRKAGKDPNKVNEFTAVPMVRKPTELRDEFENTAAATAVIESMGAKSALDGWKAAIAWVNKMDPKSQEQGRAKFEQQKAIQAEAAERRKVEREEKKAKEAADKTAAAVVG